MGSEGDFVAHLPCWNRSDIGIVVVQDTEPNDVFGAAIVDELDRAGADCLGFLGVPEKLRVLHLPYWNADRRGCRGSVGPIEVDLFTGCQKSK